METVLANMLLAHQPLADLVDDRVDWDEVPQGLIPPLVVMFLISSVPGYTYAGIDGMTRSRVQFDCRGTTREQARQVAEALGARLSGYRGIFEGVRFAGAFKQGHRTRSDRDGASGWFTASVDYLIWSATA